MIKNFNKFVSFINNWFISVLIYLTGLLALTSSFYIILIVSFSFKFPERSHILFRVSQFNSITAIYI